MNEHRHTADEAMRDRLAAADPAKRVSINPMPEHLMEHITNTTIPAPDHTDSPAPAQPHMRSEFERAFPG